MSVSWGQVIGAVAGAIIGYLAYGPYGAIVGAAWGFTLGSIVDPVRHDVKTPGVPLQPLQVAPNELGYVIPEVLGTAKLVGFLLLYGKEKARKRKRKPTKYYMTWATGICMGPVDTLYAIYANEKLVWSGTCDYDTYGDGVRIETTIGDVKFYFGTGTQTADGDVEDIIGAEYNSPLRGLCYAVMDGCYIGEFNRMPTMYFVVRRHPQVTALPANGTIQEADYNPAHALWWILTEAVGLGADTLDVASFTEAANTLYGENRGISLLMDEQQQATVYVEAILSHIDGALRWRNGKFELKLRRDDYEEQDLAVLTDDDLAAPAGINRPAWSETVNEVVVQYTEIGREIRTPGDKFYPYAMCTDGTYLYIVGAAIRGSTRYLRIERRTKYGQLCDSHEEETSGIGTWTCVAVRGGYLYAAGIDGDYKARIERRNASDLSILGWTYTYGPGATSNFQYCFHDVAAGDDRIYAVADDTWGVTSYQWGFSKATGAVVWFKTRSQAGRSVCVDDDEDYVYFTTKGGTVYKVDPDDGDLEDTYTYTNRCWIKIKYWQSVWGYDHFYVAGHTWPTVGGHDCGDTAVVRKLPLYSMSGWESTYGPMPSGQSAKWEDLALGRGAYVIGRVPFLPTPTYRIAKYDMATGALKWMRTLDEGKAAICLCYDDGYVYVAGSDSAGEFFLERRSEADGWLKTTGMQTSPTNTRPQTTPAVRDLGNLDIQGRTVNRTVKMAAFTTYDNAVWAAKRLLQSLSYPWATVRLELTSMPAIAPGDPFRLIAEGAEFILRASSIEMSPLSENKMIVEAVEDCFSRSLQITEAPEPEHESSDPETHAGPLPYSDAVEAPFDVFERIAALPLLVRASNEDHVIVYKSLDGGTSYSEDVDYGTFALRGTLVADYPMTYMIDDYQGMIVTLEDAGDLETTTWANTLSGARNILLVDDEIMFFRAITPMENEDEYLLTDIVRARMGTERAAHAAGSVVWIFEEPPEEVLTDFRRGDEVYFKFVPVNPQETGLLADAEAVELQFAGRAYTPYRPINFCANGSSQAARYTDDIILTWTARTRGAGAGVGPPGMAAPYPRREGLFRIEAKVGGSTVRTETDIDAITWTYTEEMNLADNGGSLAGEITFTLTNYIVRSDGEVYEGDPVEVNCKLE